MKVFISWSGHRSKRVAQALRDWLPDVIQDIDPWMSAVDVEAGARWGNDLADNLEGTHFGISCLTRDNQKEPWLLFEAGALSKVVEKARVCVYWLDLSPSDYAGPLSQFQWNQVNGAGTKAIIESINNNNAEDKTLTEPRLDRAFETYWPDLKKALDAIPASAESPGPERRESDMVAETLQLARAIAQSQENMMSAINVLREARRFGVSPPHRVTGAVLDSRRAVEALRRRHPSPSSGGTEVVIPTDSGAGELPK